MNLAPAASSPTAASVTLVPPAPLPTVIGQMGKILPDGTEYFTDLSIIADPSLPKTVYSSLEAARRGARELTSTEFDAGRTGSWLRRRDPRIDAIALLRNGSGGIELARTNGELDGYHVLDGYLFKRWTRREPFDLVRANDPRLLGVVSHGHWADLSAGVGVVAHTQKH